MAKEQRFCINCGRSIGDLPTCDNPDCASLPNFYRDVPGPDRMGSFFPAGGEVARAASAREPRVPGTAEGSTVIEAQKDERRTMALNLSPVAVLRSVAPPPAEHLLCPGVTEVGARQPAKIIIDRPEVSSRHARIECRLDDAGAWQVFLSDLGSRNGTYVNGEKIETRTLSHGDKVRFASVELELRMIDTEKRRVTMGI